MKQIILLFLIIILLLPVFAYEVYSPHNYSYQKNGDKLLFLIDFSNSMGEYSEHRTKTDSVKLVLKSILPQISPDTKIGLRVYGHNCNIIALNACRSSELVVPLSENSVENINKAMTKLHPKGMTPITYSLKQAVKKDFTGFDGTKHIILLTDGGENCDESPCDYSIALMKTRRDIKIDVIAFNVYDDDDLAQLKCTADVTGGRFIEANTTAQLFNSMQELISPHKNVEALLYNAE